MINKKRLWMRHCCWYQTGCSKYFTDGCQCWCRSVPGQNMEPRIPLSLATPSRAAAAQWKCEWVAFMKRFWHREAEEKVQLIYHLPQPSQGFTENRAKKRTYPVRGSCVLNSRVRLVGDHWLQPWRVGCLPGHATLSTLTTWKHPHWPLYWVHGTNKVSDHIKESHFENLQLHFNCKLSWFL